MDDDAPLFPGKLPPALPKKAIAVVPEVKGEIVRGFNSKLGGWMVDVAVKAVGEGLPMARVAGLLGVAARTLEKWRAEGQDPLCKDPLKVELAVRLEDARSRAAERGVQLMKIHATKDWKALQALLVAQDPDVWAPTTRNKVEHTLPEAKKNLENLTDAELAELERLENKMASE